MAKNDGKFKIKGTKILKDQKRPVNIREFFQKNPETDSHDNSQIANNTDTIPLIHDKPIDSIPAERLHLHIRKDLADKIYELIYSRKRDTTLKKKKASQRAIVEEALEEYFLNRGV